MPTVVYTELLGDNVLLGYSDGTTEVISVALIGEILGELSCMLDQSLFQSGRPN